MFDWQVSVTAREDVPSFGPPLPNPAVFRKVRESFFRTRQSVFAILENQTKNMFSMCMWNRVNQSVCGYVAA